LKNECEHDLHDDILHKLNLINMLQQIKLSQYGTKLCDDEWSFLQFQHIGLELVFHKNEYLYSVDQNT